MTIRPAPHVGFADAIRAAVFTKPPPSPPLPPLATPAPAFRPFHATAHLWLSPDGLVHERDVDDADQDVFVPGRDFGPIDRPGVPLALPAALESEWDELAARWRARR